MQPPFSDTQHWSLTMRGRSTVDPRDEPLANSDSVAQVPNLEGDAISIIPPAPSCDSGYGGSPRNLAPLRSDSEVSFSRNRPCITHAAASLPARSITARSSTKLLHRFTSKTRQAYDVVHVNPFSRVLNSLKGRIRTHGHVKTSALGLRTATTTASSLVDVVSPRDNDSQHDERNEEGLEITQWISATEDSGSSTLSTTRNAVTSIDSSLIAPVQCSKQETRTLPSTRALVLELWSYLQAEHHPHESFDTWQEDDSMGIYAVDINSSCTQTDGSGSDDSPKSATTSHSNSIGARSRAFPLPNRTNPKGYENEEEDQHPHKKPNREQEPWGLDLTPSPTYIGQMSCPMFDQHGCQGTNTTISELMRSLMNRHRIVICKECCTRLPIQDDEKKPADLLQRHALAGCERRCIGNSCGNALGDTASHHRRSEKCPSWATLTKETRWSFIWILVNPQSDPPNPNFLPGPSFEHSQERRPIKRQVRARGNEICAYIMRDIEAKERRISTLEIDLAAAKNETGQIQQQSKEKVANLENIIENLLERLYDNGIGLPGSLQKRLQTECPEATTGIRAKDVQANVRAPRTSIFTSNQVHYSGSDMASTAGGLFHQPSDVSMIPNPAATWNDTSQQMTGSSTGSGYYNTEFGHTTKTAKAMYPPSTHIQNWAPMGLGDIGLNAQGGEYISSETSRTSHPYQ